MTTQYYCERCSVLLEQSGCPICGKKLLRTPRENDFCFLVEAEAMLAHMFKGLLRDEQIPFAELPSGNGVLTAFALKLENTKIFVPYKFFDGAKLLLNELRTGFEQAQMSDFLSGTDKLYSLKSDEKKMKRILGLSKDENLAAYCAQLIQTADKVVAKGKQSFDVSSGYRMYVYKGDEMIVVDTATFQIILVEKKKTK